MSEYRSLADELLDDCASIKGNISRRSELYRKILIVPSTLNVSNRPLPGQLEESSLRRALRESEDE